MNIKFPTFPPGQLGSQLQTCFQTLATAFNSVVSKDEAAPRVLLTDANGQVWALSVTTAGVATTTTISGKVRQI